MTRTEAGRLGGRATVARHGREYMSKIGRRGFSVTVERYWAGDRKACLRRLQELGLMAQDPYPDNGAWQFPRKDGEPW